MGDSSDTQTNYSIRVCVLFVLGLMCAYMTSSRIIEVIPLVTAAV